MIRAAGALFTRNRVIGLALVALLFAIDQGIKHLVVDTLGLEAIGDHLALLPFFDLTRTNNYGVSLGLLEARGMEMRWGLVALTSLIAGVVLVWMMRERRLWDIVPLAMILGGALGNIRDRYKLGYVIDYADLHFGDFRPFLIFNFADACISIGVAIILARALFFDEKPRGDTNDDGNHDNDGGRAR